MVQLVKSWTIIAQIWNTCSTLPGKESKRFRERRVHQFVSPKTIGPKQNIGEP